MNWQEICAHPALQNLPFKLESDRWGHIVMTPASNRHSWWQSEIQDLMRKLGQDGYAVTECSVATTEGVKVADVAWASLDFLRRHGTANPYPEAPEIVVEVLSDSNTLAEMEEKKALYFERGSREFWLCRQDGELELFDRQGPIEHSALIPGFPRAVRLPFES
jgi:Uma2 family endonuclease